MNRPTRDEELFQRMLEGGAGAPDREAEALVKLAQALERRRPSLPGPAPDFQAVLRRRILVEAQRTVDRASLRVRAEHWLEEKNKAWRRSFRLVTATGLAAMMLLGTGVMFASANSATPADGFRYMFDRAAEAAHEAATRGAIPRALLKLDNATERLDEATVMGRRGVEDVDLYQVVFDDMDADTVDATELIVDAVRAGAGAAPLERLARFTGVQRERLEGLLTDRVLPDGAIPAARDSIEVLLRVGDRVGAIIAGCPCPSNPLQVSPTGAAGPVPGGVACSCEQPSGDGGSGSGTDGGGGDGGGTNNDPGDPGPGPGPGPGDGGGNDGLLDGIPDTGIDAVDQLVDDLVDAVESALPTPVPTAPSTTVPNPGL